MLKTDDRFLSQGESGPVRDVAGESDGDLLGRFIAEQDQSAFAEIVRRHGVMVLGVCQRVLDNRHDAEDCFQAAFMVLVRKAATINPRDMVGNWLYGVAYRTALEARKLAARRRNLEKKKHAMPKPEPTAEIWEDLKPVLDQELSRLPDKFRNVLVACDLEGKTRHEVADQLDLPEGTVASRLARGRAMLAKRLRRHRVIVTPLMLANVLAEQAAPIVLPETLVTRATRLAARESTPPAPVGRLADNVVAAMVWSKLKIATSLACAIGLLSLGVATMLPSADASRQVDFAKPDKKKPQRVTECVLRKVDLDRQEIQAARLDADGPPEIHDLGIKPATEVIIGGQVARFNDLQEGMIVHVEIQRAPNGQHQAIRIEAVAVGATGVVEEVAENSVTLRADGVAAPIELDAAAPVQIDGQPKKASELKKKMKVTWKVDVAKKTVVGVEAVGPKFEDVVAAVDVDKKSLVIAGRPLVLADNAKVIINGAPARLAELRPGMRVNVQMSANTEESRIVAVTARNGE